MTDVLSFIETLSPMVKLFPPMFQSFRLIAKLEKIFKVFPSRTVLTSELNSFVIPLIVNDHFTV